MLITKIIHIFHLLSILIPLFFFPFYILNCLLNLSWASLPDTKSAVFLLIEHWVEHLEIMGIIQFLVDLVHVNINIIYFDWGIFRVLILEFSTDKACSLLDILFSRVCFPLIHNLLLLKLFTFFVRIFRESALSEKFVFH